MVKLKCAALYTDNLGCEQATVYFLKGKFQLKVRSCIFENDRLNFEFYAKNSNKVRRLFHLKDDELVEYVIDIKIPSTLVYNNKKYSKEFLLRIERHKNYYSNSLSFYSKGVVYKVEGYDLYELLNSMKKVLPKEYNMEYSFSNIFELYYIKEKTGYYLNLFKIENKKELQKVPITYICDEYCLNQF